MIVTKLDLLARSTEDGLNLVKHWHEQGISILAREDKAVKILGVLDWISSAIIVGIYVLAFFVMAIW